MFDTSQIFPIIFGDREVRVEVNEIPSDKLGILLQTIEELPDRIAGIPEREKRPSKVVIDLSGMQRLLGESEESAFYDSVKYLRRQVEVVVTT